MGYTMRNIWVVGLAILFLNLPFGFWRAGEKKFSLHWFLAVHLPVPLVVCIRAAAGLRWGLTTFPVFITAYFAGQFFGGKLRSRLKQI
jgi:hypothetical protein